MKLYPYQEQSVNFHLYAEWSLQGSSPGLGKTAVAIAFAKRTGKKLFVVGPAFLKNTWLDEAKKFDAEIFYCSYSMVHKLFAKDLEQYGVWVADEIHMLKNPKALRTNAYYSLIKKVKPMFFLGLSGTIIRSKIFDLWIPLAICSNRPNNTNGLRLEGDLQKYRAFSAYFCNVERFKMRGNWIERFGGVREERIPELKALLKDKFIRFRVEDVLKDLPEMIRKEVNLNLKSSPGLEEAFRNYMAGSKADPTAKATSALLKAPYTAEYVENLMEAGESVLVFSDHVKATELIASKLQNSACITGATPMERRHEIVTQFQAGKIKVICATIGALSTGVTLTKARHVCFNDLSWTSSDNLQASKRIHRIGQRDVTFSHYMIASETDAHIAKTLLAKEQSILKVIK